MMMSKFKEREREKERKEKNPIIIYTFRLPVLYYLKKKYSDIYKFQKELFCAVIIFRLKVGISLEPF